MAKIIVVYDYPDPEQTLETDEQVEKRDDLRNWLEADLRGVSSIDSEHSDAHLMIASTVAVLSESEYKQTTRLIWAQGIC